MPEKDFAPGLPSRTDFGNVAFLKDRLNELFIQLHNAVRAGKHLDIRVGNPLAGLLSWATKKDLPSLPGSSIPLYQQPLHRYDYGSFEGKIERGYGKGDVSLLFKSPIKMLEVSEDRLIFSIDRGKGIERFLLVKSKKPKGEAKTWFLINITPTTEVPEKLKYKQISEEKAKELLSELGKEIASVQPKIDGALAIVRIKDKKVDIFSHRISKKTGRPILHTERILDKNTLDNLPESADDSILLGEIYAVRKSPEGKEEILSPVELSALLNSKFYTALEKLKKEGISFRIFVFDAVKRGKNDIQKEDWYEVPYKERRAFINTIIRYLPEVFHAPIEAKTNQSAEKLLKTIQKGIHPLTSEGVVIFPERGKPFKYKLYGEEDVPIIGITPGEGKYEGKGIGGLIYGKNNKPIGVVGTGLSDELREMIYKNPEEFIGRIAKIKYQEKFPSGAFRAPVFMGFHESK